MNELNRLLNEKEVAEILGVSVQHLRNQRHKGTGIPFIKYGNCVRYDQSDIYKVLNSCRVLPNR